MLKEPNFGASTADDRYARREETFKVTTKSMQRLQGFIHENLRTSGINPDAYPYTVLVAKAGLEAVAIRIEFAIISFENIASYTIDSVFNTTTNNLVSFNAFGD
jgi:isopentenyl phosphate kinase